VRARLIASLQLNHPAVGLQKTFVQVSYGFFRLTDERPLANPMETPAEELELRFVDPVESGRDLLTVDRSCDGEAIWLR
jgi:hypothetical protein